ncbi:MAG: hypothetical protein KME49_33255 [Brasilonema octagenarum HA4186-MV1]|nr:hypothetical protein [Brasilonema octagenarum HA4186-MV1]
MLVFQEALRWGASTAGGDDNRLREGLPTARHLVSPALREGFPHVPLLCPEQRLAVNPALPRVVPCGESSAAGGFPAVGDW